MSVVIIDFDILVTKAKATFTQSSASIIPPAAPTPCVALTTAIGNVEVGIIDCPGYVERGAYDQIYGCLPGC